MRRFEPSKLHWQPLPTHTYLCSQQNIHPHPPFPLQSPNTPISHSPSSQRSFLTWTPTSLSRYTPSNVRSTNKTQNPRTNPHIFACDWPGPKHTDPISGRRLKTSLLGLSRLHPLRNSSLLSGGNATRRFPPSASGQVHPSQFLTPHPLEPCQRRPCLRSKTHPFCLLQVFTKHCFCGEYSKCFYPTAGEITVVPIHG